MEFDLILREFEKWNVGGDFSGVFSVRRQGEAEFEKAYGYRHLAEKLPNKTDTKMAIASGTKFFTALTVLSLIEGEALSPERQIGEILDIDFGAIDKRITIKQLLTHTSGIGDYCDETIGVDYEAIWHEKPCYRMLRIADFLPMFNRLPAKFAPGEGCEYNNSGFLLLGLVIEKITGKSYRDAATELVIDKCGLKNSGFYYSDRLPENSAMGYIEDEKTGEKRLNVFAVPIVGGPDGGTYSSAQDIETLWTKAFNGGLISPETLGKMITPHSPIHGEGKSVSYGLGVFIINRKDPSPQYYIIGGDPGVEFFSLYQADKTRVITTLGNTGKNIWPLLSSIGGIE